MPVTREHVTKESLIEDIQNSTHAADHLEAVTNGVLYLLGYRSDEESTTPAKFDKVVSETFTEPTKDKK